MKMTRLTIIVVVIPMELMGYRLDDWMLISLYSNPCSMQYVATLPPHQGVLDIVLKSIQHRFNVVLVGY